VSAALGGRRARAGADKTVLIYLAVNIATIGAFRTEFRHLAGIGTQFAGRNPGASPYTR